MKKKLTWIGAGILVLLIAVGGILAATFKMPEFIGMEGIEIRELDEKNLHAVVNGKIFNGNFYSLSASNLDYIVTYRDTVLGKGKLPEGFRLAGGDTTQLELPVTLEMQAIFAVYKSMMAQKQCLIDIHLDGEFTSLNYQYGLDLQTEIDPDDFIQDVVGHSMGDSPISFEEFSWKNIEFGSSEIEFVSIVKNPLNAPMEMKELKLAIFEEGGAADTAGTWQLRAAVKLQPEYSTRVPGTAKINHRTAGKAVLGTVFTGEVRFDCRGMLLLQLADLPFELPIDGTIVMDAVSKKGRWEANE